MKPDTLELAVDAVIDVVRERLPGMIAGAIELALAPIIERARVAEGETLTRLDALRERCDAMLTTGLSAERVNILKELDGIDTRVVALDEEMPAAIEAALAPMLGEVGAIRARVDAHIEAVNARLAGEIAAGIAAERERAAAELVALNTRLALVTSAAGHIGVDIADAITAERTRTAGELAALTERLNRADENAAAAWAEYAEELDTQIESAVAAAVAALPTAAPGERGPPGRDASFTVPVHWHEGRLFARGSCVIHAGGLWYANVDSDAAPDAPCSGFSLILDGVVPHEVTHDEHGYTGLAFKFASGKRLVLPMHYRPPHYCGVYEAERAYEPNDLVTCAGSIWWARGATRGTKPGTDPGARVWLLSVKCGRDGERGERGPTGERGPPGERGLVGERGPPGRDGKPHPKAKAAANGASP